MIKPFKLFKGYIYSDEYTFPTVRRSTPPFGLSQRHWNIMPEDLRNATEQEMLLYIEGWLSCRSNDNVNPYDDIRRRELWNRGYMVQLNRTLGPRVEEERDNMSDNDTQTVEFLREYHRRLDYVYIFNYNVFTQSHPLYEQTSSLFTRTYDLIGHGILRSHQQIRRYLHLGYRDIAEGASLPPFRASQETHQSIVFDTYNYITSR